MKIENSNQPAFRAKLLNRIKIGKLTDGKYTNKSVSFVKINPFNQGDTDALEYCAKYWENDKFAKNIYYAACALKEKSKFYKGSTIYALTSQKSGFKNLDKDKILGVIHTSHYLNRPMFIEHIHANSDILKMQNPDFKGIGTAILNSLKKISDEISCFPSREKSVKDFYKKNGFKKQPNSFNFYVWKG